MRWIQVRWVLTSLWRWGAKLSSLTTFPSHPVFRSCCSVKYWQRCLWRCCWLIWCWARFRFLLPDDTWESSLIRPSSFLHVSLWSLQCCWLIPLVFNACRCCRSRVLHWSTQLTVAASSLFLLLASWGSALPFILEVTFENVSRVKIFDLRLGTSWVQNPTFACVIWGKFSVPQFLHLLKKRKTVQIGPKKDG